MQQEHSDGLGLDIQDAKESSKDLRSIDDVLTFVLTRFNQRQRTLMSTTLSNSEFVGLRAMLKLELSSWIKNELSPVEELFPIDDVDTEKDLLQRIVLYLVHRYGQKIEGLESVGMVIAEDSLNSVLGADARITPKDNSFIITVTK